MLLFNILNDIIRNIFIEKYEISNINEKQWKIIILIVICKIYVLNWYQCLWYLIVTKKINIFTNHSHFI